MLRKLAIAIAASGAMMSASTIHALGMGDIELDSALNQPLNARIKLLKANELEDWEIKPDLAAREDFDKSGVERVFFLNSLKFEVVRDGSEVFVDVTSDQPVVEPFLNFLVRVDWPNGRLLREYTLLLDPPVFEEESIPSEVAAPQVQNEDSFEDDPVGLPGVGMASESDDISDIPDYVESEEQADDVADIPDYQDEESPSSEDATASQVMEGGAGQEQGQIDEDSVEVSESAFDDSYTVRANDTLWEVAVKTRPNRDVSPQQAMLAIQDLNPDAFINGNINRLKKNQVLRVPSEEQMLSRSFDEAVADVALQNEAFAQRKAQLDATRKESVVDRSADSTDGKLTLLASGEASSDAERGATGRVDSVAAGDQSSIENELNLALENLDKSSRENQELRARLDAMEEQITTLQRLINLKDEQMVALQSGMAAPDEMSEEDMQAAMAKPSDNAQIEEKVDAKEGDDSLMVSEVSPEESKDLNFQDPAEKVAKTEPSGEMEKGVTAQDKPAAKPKPKPKFVYEPPVEEPFDVVEFAFENPQIPGGILGALLLALLGVSRARKKKEADEEQALPETAELSGQDPLDDIDGDFDNDFDSEFSDLDLGDEVAAGESVVEGFDEEAVDAGLPESLDESEGHEGTDVLGEVEVYMAYNRIEPAKALLEKTIQEQPGRMDLRLKMMEVLSEMDDSDGVSEQFEVLMAQGSDVEQSQAKEIKSRLEGGADHDLSAGGGDFGSGLDLTDSGADELSSLDLGDSDSDSELDFDLDGLDLDSPSGDSDLGLDLDSTADETGLGLDLDEGDLGLGDSSEGVELDLGESDTSLDFDMDLNSGDSSDSASGIEDLSADEELDLDLGGEVAEESNSLDFDLDLGGDESIEEITSEIDVDTADEAGLDLDVPELGDDLNLDVDLEAGETLDMGSTEELSLGGDLPELDSDLDLEFDAPVESESTEANEVVLDAGLDLPAQDDSLDIDVPDLEVDSLDELDVSLDEGELNADLNESSEEMVDLDIPSLDDLDDSDNLDIPSLGDQEEVVSTADDSSDLGDLSSLSEGMDDLEGDLDFLSGTDESETKLDLARAYIDMDDKDGAKEILQEVLEEGTDDQKQEASKLMDSMV